MNFFERQAAARRQTRRLLVLFALAVVGIVAAVDVGVVLAYGYSPAALVVATLATLAVIAGGSLFRIASLADGGASVARGLGGVEIAADTADFNLRRLRNVVEEVAIASGVPMPRLFVLEQEAGINAFAAGYAPTDAAIAVTRGALDRLNRDELQGVIAHEFSHVLNGDMRLNIRLIGLLFGILMIGLAGRKFLEHGPLRRRGAMVLFGTALTLMLIGYVGLLFGRLIKAGISRSREQLADASAVQFTRQGAGLAGALKKIAGIAAGARLNRRDEAEEVSNMLFGDGVGFSGLFATHPPLLARIQALEPGFDAAGLQALQVQWLQTPPDGIAEDRLLGFAQAPTSPPLPSAGREIAVDPHRVVAQVAQPADDHFRAAERIAAVLPDTLRALAADRETAPPLLLGLLLDTDAGIAAAQRAAIATGLGTPMADAATQLATGALAGLHPMLRLPLAALAFPVLRNRPRAELDAFVAACEAVVHADGEVSLFEYCLARMLQVQVREAIEPARHARFGLRKLGSLKPEASALLAVLAQLGHGDEANARRAYNAGSNRLFGNQALAWRAHRGGVQALDIVWEPLDRLEPLAKQALLEAVTATVGHDDRISVAEAELLRAICAILHCPLPPILHA